jgi:hypothetical protein
MSSAAAKRERELTPKPIVRAKAVLVCRDGQVMGEAVVVVSMWDPNWSRNRSGLGFDGKIRIVGGVVKTNVVVV